MTVFLEMFIRDYAVYFGVLAFARSPVLQ